MVRILWVGADLSGDNENFGEWKGIKGVSARFSASLCLSLRLFLSESKKVLRFATLLKKESRKDRDKMVR
jgi:hypothetical protein